MDKHQSIMASTISNNMWKSVFLLMLLMSSVLLAMQKSDQSDNQIDEYQCAR